MNMTPIIVIVSSVLLVALITIALRITIKRDRAAIKGDMDEPHEIQQYNENWGDKE